MRYLFSKEIYSKNAMLRAAYKYTNDYYVHLSVNDESYIVDIVAKSNEIAISTEEFQNEILAQTVRENVFMETKELRTLIMARAFASSVIDDSCNDEENYYTENDENILKDWFEQNE